MVLHFPKISIKNVFKRSCALLAALCIALYSLITAPLFGVHAVDSDKLRSLLTDCLSSINSTLGGVVGGFAGSLVTGLASSISPYVTDPSDDAPLTIPRTQPVSSYVGTYSRDGETRNICFYCYTYSNWDTLPSTAYGCKIDNFIYCEDYSVSLTVLPDEDWIASDDRSNMIIRPAISYRTSSSSCDITPVFTVIGSSNPIVDFIFTFTFSDGNTFTWRNSVSATSTSSTISSGAYFRLFGSDFSFPTDLQNHVNASFLSYPSNAICILGNFVSRTNYCPNVITTPIISNSQCIDLYNNQVRNYIITNYSDYPEITNTYVTYNDYTYIEPTDPTEPNTGTTGGVIIIDPFTLPPEWLEDNAELGTSHYELDSEQWEDPLEIIKKYKHADPSGEIPTGVVNDDGSYEGPADVVEAMEAFTDYAYMILTESGLLWVVASLVSVGLVVRLFTLK